MVIIVKIHFFAVPYASRVWPLQYAQKSEEFSLWNAP